MEEAASILHVTCGFSISCHGVGNIFSYRMLHFFEKKLLCVVGQFINLYEIYFINDC